MSLQSLRFGSPPKPDRRPDAEQGWRHRATNTDTEISILVHGPSDVLAFGQDNHGNLVVWAASPKFAP